MRLRYAIAALFYAGNATASPADRCIAAADGAQQHRDNKELLRARQELVECSAQSCPAMVRQDCTRWLDEVNRALPSIVFIVRDDSEHDLHDVTVSMDGRRLVERLDGSAVNVDPGDHVFMFESGDRRLEQRVFVQTGERNRPLVVRIATPKTAPTPAPAAPKERVTPSPSPTAPIVLGIGGAAAFGVGLILGAIAKGDLDTLESAPCAATKQCRTSDVDAIRTRYAVADVTMGIGIVALGIAGVLWLTGRHGATRTF